MFDFWGGTVGTPYLWSNLYSTTSGQTVAAVRQVIERNGSGIVSDNTASSFTGTNQPFYLGSDNSSAFNGRIAEFAVYTGAISAIEHSKIESYLAIKYGVTLDNTGVGTAGDYTATDGTIVWDADLTSVYHNDVLGIGRDDNEFLDQKQSYTIDDSTRIYISTLAAANAANAGSITADVSYVLVGDNGGQMNATPTSNVEKPGSVLTRIEREWKVTKTNFSDSFNWDLTVSSDAIPASIDPNDLRLLVDPDGDFTDATVYAAGGGLSFSYANPGITVTGISNTQIPDNTTRYISIASANAATPLPIILLSFEAKTTENGEVQLDWVTASEINNDYFTIEKSEDAKEWQEVRIVDGKGSSSQLESYTVIDNSPYQGISYYRLKQTDLDGQHSFSQVRSVTVDRLEKAQIHIFPNPTHSQFIIQGPKSEIDELRMYNLQGQDMSAFIKVVENSGFRKTIDISRLPVGIYVVKTTTTVNKVIKQ